MAERFLAQIRCFFTWIHLKEPQYSVKETLLPQWGEDCLQVQRCKAKEAWGAVASCFCLWASPTTTTNVHPWKSLQVSATASPSELLRSESDTLWLWYNEFSDGTTLGWLAVNFSFLREERSRKAETLFSACFFFESSRWALRSRTTSERRGCSTVCRQPSGTHKLFCLAERRENKRQNSRNPSSVIPQSAEPPESRRLTCNNISFTSQSHTGAACRVADKRWTPLATSWHCILNSHYPSSRLSHQFDGSSQFPLNDVKNIN